VSRFEAAIEALAFGGDGVAHAPDGRTLFVPYSAPGDRAQLEITEAHKTYARAKISSLVQAGPGRAEPPCPVFGECGGCQWQHLDYPTQLASKENFVREALRRIGGFAEPPVQPIIPASSPYAYRNKAIVPLDGLGAFGFYRASSHEIVPLPESGCAIQSPATDQALKFLRTRVAGIPGLKHAAVRGNRAGETLIVLVSAAPLGIEAEATAWLKELPGLRGVLNNLQPRPGNTVFGPQTQVLAGRSHIIEELDGLKFRLSGTSFFQVNSAQAMALTALLLAARGWKRDEKVLELYCGVGTLSLPLARAGMAVLGVENWPEAVEDARLNARENDLGSARFECADALQGFRFMPKPAVLLLDPPRKGLSPEVLKGAAQCGADEILYVSCDPSSLARDLKGLVAGGWKLKNVRPLDMFPQTYHVESLAVLGR
jgi:23S rRNA (uracil1939-C5)-methyltransferase